MRGSALRLAAYARELAITISGRVKYSRTLKCSRKVKSEINREKVDYVIFTRKHKILS